MNLGFSQPLACNQCRGAQALHALHDFITNPLKPSHFPSPTRFPIASDVWNPGNRPTLVPIPFRPDLSFFVPQTLLVDGYISQTFRSRAAEQYFLNLLKSASIPPHATLSCTEKEEVFFFVYSVPPHILVRSHNPPDRWLLDRGVMSRGTVVPQMMWSPRSVVDIRQHVERAKLQMPVFFEDKDRGLGLSLGAFTDGQYHGLRDANDPAPLSQKTTTHIRIVVSMASVDLLTLAKIDLH